MRRVCAIATLLCSGCGPATPVEDSREVALAEDRDAARKRECVATLTADAEPRVHTLLRSLCSEWVALDVPGVALALVEPGKPPLHAELGVRCSGDAAKVEANTAFRIGSVSKPVTAALAFALIAEGKLELGSDASQIPGFASQAGLPPPQLDALLRHRSGLGEIEPATLVELDGAWLPALARATAAGAPGEYHYSNAGYSLIGALLEVASGRGYTALIRERIGEPLGLASLTADPSSARAAACGHLSEDRRPISVASDLDFMPGDPRWMSPAGGLLSSAMDLANFALAIGSDRLPGSAAMLELGDESYGYGLRSWQLDADTRVYGHSGNNASFVAELLFVPGVGAIAILANRGVELPATLAAAEALLGQL